MCVFSGQRGRHLHDGRRLLHFRRQGRRCPRHLQRTLRAHRSRSGSTEKVLKWCHSALCLSQSFSYPWTIFKSFLDTARSTVSWSVHLPWRVTASGSITCTSVRRGIASSIWRSASNRERQIFRCRIHCSKKLDSFITDFFFVNVQWSSLLVLFFI